MKKLAAFTLVELIVVITILAILGTIGFLSLSGYSKSARDSTRLSDINTLKKGLEFYSLNTGKYPEPDNGVEVSYTGTEVWTQGVAGDEVLRQIKQVSNIPKDPLLGSEYTYSLLHSNKEYEFGSMIESDNTLGFDPQTYANTKKAYAYISGTYNGRVTKIYHNGLIYIFALPSIINSDLSEPDIEKLIAENKLVISGYSNLPGSYIDYGYDTGGDNDLVSVNKLIVYTGATLPESTFQVQKMLEGLQEAYSGVTISNQQGIGELVDNDYTAPANIKNIGEPIVKYILGGNPSIQLRSCDGEDHLSMRDFYQTGSVAFGQSCDPQKKTFSCYDGTWMDGENVADTATYQYGACIIGSADDCGIETNNYNGHTYNFMNTSHGIIANLYSENVTENNGTFRYPVSATCFDGNYISYNESPAEVVNCDEDFYNPGNNTCIAVGNGFYSAAGDSNRYSCTNKAASNSSYTSDGGGVDNCSWTCDTYHSNVGGLCTPNTWYSETWGSCSATPSWTSWGSCSLTCGGGTQTRTCQNTSGTETRLVECRMSDSTPIADGLCSGTKPYTSQSCSESCVGSDTQACNTHACCTDTTWTYDKTNVRKISNCGTIVAQEWTSYQYAKSPRSCFERHDANHWSRYWLDGVVMDASRCQTGSAVTGNYDCNSCSQWGCGSPTFTYRVRCLVDPTN